MKSEIITINGNNFYDIPSFYDEMNRLFMAGQDWKIGPSLDALNDILQGGFGPVKGNDPITVVWKSFEKSQRVLGYDVMHAHLAAKLLRPQSFNIPKITQDILELERTGHPTYIEQILEVIADHPNITLIKD